MNKTAETQSPILPEIANRWSPRAYDKSYVLSNEDIVKVLEAARWAPSANNLQPWRFSVVTRGEKLHETISTQALSGFNAAWVPNASGIVFISIPTQAPDGRDYTIAWFDAGLAAQNLMIEAQAIGLASHPLSGFDSEKVTDILALPEGYKAIAAITLGKRAEPEALEGGAYEREIAPRTRLALHEIVLHGLN